MSWIVLEKETKRAVCELFDKRSIEKLNKEKYEVITVMDYLENLNRELRK